MLKLGVSAKYENSRRRSMFIPAPSNDKPIMQHSSDEFECAFKRIIARQITRLKCKDS